MATKIDKKSKQDIAEEIRSLIGEYYEFAKSGNDLPAGQELPLHRMARAANILSEFDGRASERLGKASQMVRQLIENEALDKYLPLQASDYQVHDVASGAIVTRTNKRGVTKVIACVVDGAQVYTAPDKLVERCNEQGVDLDLSTFIVLREWAGKRSPGSRPFVSLIETVDGKDRMVQLYPHRKRSAEFDGLISKEQLDKYRLVVEWIGKQSSNRRDDNLLQRKDSLLAQLNF